MHEICKTLIDVPLECIINIDKLALQHYITFSRSYCTVNLDGHGVKHSKEQITVSLRVSTSGEKFTTQAIEKSTCPHALKNIPDISKALESSMIIKLKPGKINCLFHICTCCTSTTELPRTAVSSSNAPYSALKSMGILGSSQCAWEHHR